jgi:uncharacterized tellurite resistance protein B-like protein
MNQELLASLRILAHVARADAHVRSEERLALDALGERDGGATAYELVHDKTELEELLAAVKSPEIQRRTLIEAIALANVDGKCAPEEHALLLRIREGFGLADSIDLEHDSAAWKRRSAKVRKALDDATAAYLHKVHSHDEHAELTMGRYDTLVGELGRATHEIQHAFAEVVDEVENKA